jgi:putative copper resistance protein D
VFAPALFLTVALAVLVVALVFGGAAAERDVLDPGAFVRFGLPVSRMIVNIAAAGMIGSLVFAVWVLARKRQEYGVALDFAAGSAATLTVASLATLLFTFVEIAGITPSAQELFGSALAQFVTDIEVGQLWLLVVIFAAVTTVLAFAIRDQRAVLVVLAAAVVTIVPLAQQGHAAGASGHNEAVTSLTVHLIAVAVWLGGLLTVVVLSRSVDRTRLVVITLRYSSLALLAFIGVASSGVVSSVLRVGSFSDLVTTGYGWILVAKIVTLTALGVFGFLQRKRFIGRLNAPGSAGTKAFWMLITLELAIMGVASGLAAALGRTQTPVPQTVLTGEDRVTPAEWLTGEPLPAEITATTMFTAWKFDLGWTLVAVFAIFFYLAGVWRLRQRGDRWPIHRTVLWVAGVVFLFYATNGILNAYEKYLFSVHMLGHMLLAMVIPTLLVLGAPITLALRTIQKRKDGSWGTREWIMWGLHTPYAKFITHPIVAAMLFAGSLWIFYYTPLMRWATTDHLGHQWMIIHFVFTGYLFALSLVGIDPIPYRFPYPLRLVTLFATMAFHAFFGISIMSNNSLLLADWYGAMGRTWGLPPLADQSLGGGIAWGLGELPSIMLAILVALEWSRSDDRKAKRRDRDAERTGDRELNDYNAMLAQRAARSNASTT